MEGNVQMPFYMPGNDFTNYTIFLDNVYKQNWGRFSKNCGR